MEKTLLPALPVDGVYVGTLEERGAQVVHHDSI